MFLVVNHTTNQHYTNNESPDPRIDNEKFFLQVLEKNTETTC